MHNVEELRQIIVDNCELFRQTEGIFVRVHSNFLIGINLCGEKGGHHFEQVL